MVNPARAGMIPVNENVLKSLGRKPRASGDDPGNNLRHSQHNL